MLKSWLFEFLHAPAEEGADVHSEAAASVLRSGISLWNHVERLGFEGIFFSEHHFAHSYSPAPNLFIAAIAQRTSRLRLGTMGMVLPFYAPWRVLEEIALLDHLTGGRLEIGSACGVPQELARVGIPMAEARERFNEALDILDAGLAQPVISHHGKYWNFDDLKILPRTLQNPPPKWTTVVSEGSARKSARRGSKISTAFQSVGRVNEIFDAYRHEADRVGLSVGPNHFAIRRNISVAPTRAEAEEISRLSRDASRRVLAGDTRVAAKNASLLDAPSGATGFAIDDDDYIAGTPDQVAEQIIEQCRTCGAGHILGILGRGADAGREEMVTLFGDKVVPIIRRA
jgi:alkanesulfonate monooxygenase SsuD/methylene tetrahydromethanopterin reductase-like flavin-dependent oxidoreductase (luciferase family)